MNLNSHFQAQNQPMALPAFQNKSCPLKMAQKIISDPTPSSSLFTVDHSSHLGHMIASCTAGNCSYSSTFLYNSGMLLAQPCSFWTWEVKQNSTQNLWWLFYDEVINFITSGTTKTPEQLGNTQEGFFLIEWFKVGRPALNPELLKWEDLP